MQFKTLGHYHASKQNCFNWIRFLAAFYVIVCHSFDLTNTHNFVTEFLIPFPSGASYGVVVFFLISGFLITESFVRRHDPVYFLQCRCLRIYPGLIACVLFCVLVVGIAMTRLPAWDYLAHRDSIAFLLHNSSLYHWLPNLPGVFVDNPRLSSVNGSLWTLPVEFKCYLVILAVGILGGFRNRIVQGMYLAISLAAFIWFGSRKEMSQEAFFSLTFLLGSVMYLLRNYITLHVLITAGLGGLAALLWGKQGFSLAYLAFVSHAVFMIAYRLPKLGTYVTRHGDFSYGLYIYAFPVQQTVIQSWKGVGGWPVLCIAFPVTLLLAVISWRYIEKPALELKKHNVWDVVRALGRRVAGLGSDPGKNAGGATPQWEEVYRCARAGFDWCLAKAQQSRRVGRLEESLGWSSVAAWAAGGCGFSGIVASPEMERELARCAQEIGLRGSVLSTEKRKRWVHVFDEAYVVGGHTALCWRWVEARAKGEMHSVLLIRQRVGVPERLRRAVESSGGNVHLLEPNLGLVERAKQISEIAQAHADVVVLHTHPDSVAPAVAFGNRGGPPVVVVNHADHLFQATTGIADLVFDIRESGAEWTRICRGLQATTTLPVPLLDPLEGKEAVPASENQQFRDQLGLPRDSVVLLTVGSGFKYNPIPGVSFHAAIEPVLMAHPQAWLVAVGPEDDGEWLRLRKLTGGRVLALGRREDLAAYHAMADIYLEGYPMGSLTALLEAGLAGLPCVRAPRQVPPPFCSDGIAFEGLAQPTSLEEYGRRVAELIRDPKLRSRQAQAIRASVKEHHCGDGWVRYLEAGIAKVPSSHKVNFDRQTNCVLAHQRDYWIRCCHALAAKPGAEDIGAAILGEAVARRLKVDTADYARLGEMLEMHSAHATGNVSQGQPQTAETRHNVRGMARRLEQILRQDLRRRRLLKWWEVSKQRVFQPLGITGLVRRFGRIMIGELRR